MNPGDTPADEALTAFRCPARECRHDESSLGLDDAKTFYVHWLSTHKPRCPRTDCRFSIQDLSKTTESYFLRHWTTHFPKLNISKSTCGKCGRQFANANNRDRHASKCKGSTSTGCASPIEAELFEVVHGAISDHDGSRVPDDDPNAQHETTAYPNFSNELPHDAIWPSFEEIPVSSTWPEEPSHGAIVALSTPDPQLVNYAMPTCGANMSLHDNTTLSSVPTTELLEESASVFSTPSPRLARLVAELFPLPQGSPPEAEHQRVIEWPQDTTGEYVAAPREHSLGIHTSGWMPMSDVMCSSTRKRALEDPTCLPAKKHQSASSVDGELQAPRSAIRIDYDLNALEPFTLPGSDKGVLEPAAHGAQVCFEGHAGATVDVDPPAASLVIKTTVSSKNIKRYTLLSTSHLSKHLSGSEHREIHKQIFAVKTFRASTGGLREVSFDHHTRIRKRVYQPRKIKVTSSYLINNVVMSEGHNFFYNDNVLNHKKTRYPKVINNNSAIFKFCATGQKDEVNRLLSLGEATIVDVNTDGDTLLHIAAANFRFDLCQLLVDKGADVEARNWKDDKTPFGLLCHHEATIRYQAASSVFRLNDNLKNIFGLLLDNGIDIQTSVELNEDLFALADAYCDSSHSLPQEYLRIIPWLVQRYLQTITCDGALPSINLHVQVYDALRHCIDEFDAQDLPGDILTPKDLHAFQSFWLHSLQKRWGLFSQVPRQFFRTYTGDYHYQRLWDMEGCTARISPMQMALTSLRALANFRYILSASGIDIVEFAEKESTMPWCTDTKETLMNFFSFESKDYEAFEYIVSSPTLCDRCWREFQYKGLIDWGIVVGLVRSGNPLAIVLSPLRSDLSEEDLESVSYLCEDCHPGMTVYSDSDDSRTDLEECNNEGMGFIETDDEIEVEAGEDSHNIVHVSMTGDEQIEGGTRIDLSEELSSSSSEASSDEDSGDETY